MTVGLSCKLTEEELQEIKNISSIQFNRKFNRKDDSKSKSSNFVFKKNSNTLNFLVEQESESALSMK
jgi:hypothetical protein